MKHFFSIAIHHEYHKSNHTTGVFNDLIIIPAQSNDAFIQDNRLLFRYLENSIECYIEDNEALKNETDVLFFWVVCKDYGFYNYTDYPNHISFSVPQYYWSNSEDQTTLQQTQIGAQQLETPPRNAIGCIGISIHTIPVSENIEFIINFKTRKTFWQYHIILNAETIDGNYQIEDNFGEWSFKRIDSDGETIIFQSESPIAFQKKADNRLQLIWGPETSSFNEKHSIILPFANFKYKMVDQANNELTPIYIHI